MSSDESKVEGKVDGKAEGKDPTPLQSDGMIPAPKSSDEQESEGEATSPRRVTFDGAARKMRQEREEKEREEQEAARGGGGLSWMRYLDVIGVLMIGVAMLGPHIMGDGSNKPPVLDVVELDQSFYKTVLYPDKPDWDKYGPNDQNVSWAVFFHKPYCGACRRVRPIFHALARTTNSSEHLRFGSVDCVKYRVFCQRERVNREPLIRIYQALPPSPAPPLVGAAEGKGKKKSKGFARRGVVDWQGMLVAYEVLGWFKSLTTYGGPLEGKSISWAGDDELSQAMDAFKKSKLHTGQKLDSAATSMGHLDPKGYLTDLDSAMLLGLVDDVFGGFEVLEGKRLVVLVNWLETLAHTHPSREMRERLWQLRSALGQRDLWNPKSYQNLLDQWGLRKGDEPPPTGEDSAGLPSKHYKWCRSNEPGQGGYPCGLWILFHSMLANSDVKRAHLTLYIIYEWVQNFYGCVECAANFNQEWEENDGPDQRGHIETSLWLWRVHNMVRARLTEEDDGISPKPQWPSPSECAMCLSKHGRQRLGLPTLPRDLGQPSAQGAMDGAFSEAEIKAASLAASEGTPVEVLDAAKASLAEDPVWRPGDWDEDFVFSYLQETFCAGSDTLNCGGFVDEQD